MKRGKGECKRGNGECKRGMGSAKGGWGVMEPGVCVSARRSKERKNPTFRQRHLGGAALTEADSTIWVERGRLTRQSGFQTTAARSAWLNRASPRGRLVRLKLFWGLLGLSGDGSSYPGCCIPRRGKKRRCLSGVYQTRHQIKRDLISRRLRARTNRWLFPADERQREMGEKIRLAQRNFSN